MSPEWVRSSASAALASPKSATQTLPLGSSRRFDGLTSRWRTPWRLAYSSASATWRPIRATLRKKVRSGSDRASESAEAPGRLTTEESAGLGATVAGRTSGADAVAASVVPGRGIPLLPSAGENRPVRIASATSAALTAPLDRPRPRWRASIPRALRSRRNSSRTASRPMPGMNCMT